MHDITADITLLATEEGGRRGPTPPDVFGCMLEIDGNFCDCRLVLSPTGALSPGDNARVAIQFLNPELALPLFRIGAEFSLWEAGTIGHGTVADVETQT